MPGPEAKLGLLDIHKQVVAALRQLFADRTELQVQCREGEKERASLEAEIVSRKHRLEQLQLSLERRSSEKEGLDLMLKTMEREHSAIVNNSRDLLNLVRHEGGRLFTVDLREVRAQ